MSLKATYNLEGPFGKLGFRLGETKSLKATYNLDSRRTHWEAGV